MYKENNLQNRVFIVGGPPRIGKSRFSAVYAEKLRAHITSTDAILAAVKKSLTNEEGNLFAINQFNQHPEAEWLRIHHEEPDLVIDAQNKESIAGWPSIEAYINSFVEDDLIHLVEGVHLLPVLASQMKNPPKNVFFLGNTNPDHVNNMIKYAREFPEKDWMGALNYSDEKITAMANFVLEMSLYFKNEAEKYGFDYYELDGGKVEEFVSKLV